MNEKVVIAVPVWDSDPQFQFTADFICQMQDSVEGNFLVVIIDNASPSDFTKDFLKDISDPRFHVIHNSENEGYGRAANQGIAYGFEHGCEYGFVMNNDVVFFDSDWIETAFLQYLRDDHNLLMGARLIDFNTATAYDGTHIEPYLEGWLLAFHKDLWEGIGGFDPKIWLWHEDAELAVRARKMGYTLRQSPAFHWVSESECKDSPVHHIYGQTGFAKLGGEFRSISETSRQYVIQKHFS